MHLLRQQQQYQLFCLFFIFITQTVSIPIQGNIQSTRCNPTHENCTLILRNSSSTRLPGIRIRPPRPSPFLYSSSTSRLRSTSRVNSVADFDAFSENLKRAALILAGIALGLGILRICLMLCKSRPQNASPPNYPSGTGRSRISTIDQHQFKPDLPPAYAEAIANMENDGTKLPTYEELPGDQRSELHAYNNTGYSSTQM